MTSLEVIAEQLKGVSVQLKENGDTVKRLTEEVYIGAPGRPSIREDLAMLKKDAATRSIPPPPVKVPPAVWKAIATLIIAIATLLGGYAGSKQLSQATANANRSHS